MDLCKDNEMSHYASEKVPPCQKRQWKEEWRNILQTCQSHQNILRFFTACSCDPNNTIIISEQCDEDLETYIKNKCVSSGKATDEKTRMHFQTLMDLLQGIAQGVQHLHCNGIIHCKIKRSCVLLSKNSKNLLTAKLGRFIYSKKINKNGIQISRKIETSKNEAAYAAPECWGKKTFWSKSSDVFAFGILMYYALTGGMHPFGQTSTDPEIVDNLKNEKNKTEVCSSETAAKRVHGV